MVILAFILNKAQHDSCAPYYLYIMMILFVYIDVCLHFLYYTYAHTFMHTLHTQLIFLYPYTLLCFCTLCPHAASLSLFCVPLPSNTILSQPVPNPLPVPLSPLFSLSLSFVHMLHCSSHTPVWKFCFFQCIWEPLRSFLAVPHAYTPSSSRSSSRLTLVK